MTTADTGGTLEGIVVAKVIRADGTEEDLGIISVTSADAERIISELKALQPEPKPLTLEDVNAMHAERSAENDAATEANRAESPMTALLGVVSPEQEG